MYKALKGAKKLIATKGAARPCKARHKAYGSVATQTANPRELEADLLLKPPRVCRRSMTAGTAKQAERTRRSTYNRRLWSIF